MDRQIGSTDPAVDMWSRRCAIRVRDAEIVQMGNPRDKEQVLLKTLLIDQGVYFLLNSPIKLYWLEV